jgi:Ni,Fe-hydrogenase III small subunit/NAD-dependent dihydropyrimidine dehydrogenase PreA subunit
MFDTFRVKHNQGFRGIKDVRAARPPEGFRGLPVIEDRDCPNGCFKCGDVCPTGAISFNPLAIDLNKCLLCPECVRVCTEGTIRFTNSVELAASEPSSLIITAGGSKAPVVKVNEELRRHFKRSLKLRSVSAGGCNGCELELTALSNVNFDIGRFGIDFVASPRHADGLVLTGPITRGMAHALRDTYEAMPTPKALIAVGACALSGGLFSQSSAIDRTFLDDTRPSLCIAGCPPHPLTVINGLLKLLGMTNL